MVVQKKIKKDDGHTFAFSLLNVETHFIPNSIVISDADVVHRMFRVVRLVIGDVCILFDNLHHHTVEIAKIDKRQVVCTIIKTTKNPVYTPFITYLLPLLKKDALHEAVYSLVEIGVNKIQLIVTSKSRQQITDKEFDKLNKVVIAAAEQSKHYVVPELCMPKYLESCIQELSDKKNKILFDVEGSSFFELQHVLIESEICLLVGPEGGLTDEERNNLVQSNFQLCLLTPTILRAVQAVAVSSALFRLQ